jgi:fatty acid desaturase
MLLFNRARKPPSPMVNQYQNQRDNHRESMFQLIRGILQDVRTLSTKELLAARLEIRQEIGAMVKASVSLAIGAFMAAVGVIFLSLMVVFLLVQYAILPLWISLGIVGLTHTFIGGVIVWIGKSKAGAAKPYPGQTVRSAKEDVRYIGARISGHQKENVP